MRIFLLDDEVDFYPRVQLRHVLEPTHDVTVARSCPNAIETFTGLYDLLMLDHDMEGFYEYREDYPNTGIAFVTWLVEHVEEFFVGQERPDVILHSQNPVGRERMRRLLEDHGFVVTECPFSSDYVKQLREQFGGA